jgi:hypothetical protein
MKVTVTCLSPKQIYEGWEGGVLWYNLDSRFDMLCLVWLLQARIHQGIIIY